MISEFFTLSWPLLFSFLTGKLLTVVAFEYVQMKFDA